MDRNLYVSRVPPVEHGDRRPGGSGQPGAPSAQFWVLLAILVLAPLPLAGNRPWALALLGISVAALALWNLWRPELERRRHGARTPWQRALIPLGLMAAWVGVLALQLVPLPQAVARMLDLAPADGYPVVLPGASVLSVDPYSTRLFFAKAVVLFAFMALALRLVNSHTRIDLLAKAIVFSGFVQAVLGVVLMTAGAHYVLFFVDIDHLNAKGTFVNRNHLAGYLEMALSVGIGLMIAKLEGSSGVTWKAKLRGALGVLMTQKAILRVVLIIMVVGLIATRSRMGNTAFFASLLLVGVTAIVLSKHATRSTVLFIASLVVLDVVIIGGVVGVETVIKRIEQTNLHKSLAALPAGTEASGAGGEVAARGDAPAAQVAANKPRSEAEIVRETEESVESRAEPGLHALRIFKDFPVLGTGGGTFHLAFLTYRPAEVVSYFDHAHNDFFQFASETGLVGVGLLGAMVLLSAFHALRILLVRSEQFARGMAFATLMAIVALMMHSAVDFNLQIPANALLFVTILTLPYLVGSRGHATREVRA